MKKIALILSVLLAIFILSGCERSAEPAIAVSEPMVAEEVSRWDEIVQQNELRVGVPSTGSSFDNELIDMFAKELGIPVTKVVIPWDETRSDYLKENQVDLLWGQIPATSDTSAAFRLSTPYFNSTIAYISYDPDLILDENTVIGVIRNSAEEQTVRSYYPNINTYAGKNELFAAMAGGSCDVVLYNKDIHEASFQKGNLHTIKEVPYELVVAFEQNNVSVCTEVEKILAKIKADGSASEICLRWYPVDLITK